MRILTVSKRQYMGHDLLDDQFGRFREIPLALARRGHDVRGLCLSYAPRGNAEHFDYDEQTGARVVWNSFDLGRGVLPGLRKFIHSGASLVKNFRPDVIWAGSDGFYGAIAQRIASDSRVVFDVYDDFESFRSSRVPGVRALFRASCRRADGVTSFSSAMSEHICEDIGRLGPTLTLMNATDTSLFRPLDKLSCRTALGLPLEASLVGFGGSISKRLGVEQIVSAVERVVASHPDVHLVLAGPREPSVQLPKEDWFHYLGVLRPQQMPLLLNAIDVGVVLQRLGRAGNFGLPYKTFEMLACDLPIIAADAGSVREILGRWPELLFDRSSTTDVVRALEYQLEHEFTPSVGIPDWDRTAVDFIRFLEAAVLRSAELS